MWLKCVDLIDSWSEFWRDGGGGVVAMKGADDPSYCVFTLRKPGSPLRINGERSFLRENRLYTQTDVIKSVKNKIRCINHTSYRNETDSVVLMRAVLINE